MQKENRNEEAVSPVIATILMVAITVVLAGVLYVWASSLAEGNTDGNLALYAMSGKDAQGSPSVDTADNLIMLTMDQGGDINWAAVSVKLAIDGAAPVTCDNPGVDGTSGTDGARHEGRGHQAGGVFHFGRRHPQSDCSRS